MRGTRFPVSVSVAIPTFRREAVLVRTVRQVLAQEPPADEVLVIDQTDRHELPTEAFLDEGNTAGRIRWIRHQLPNLPAARNRALREASSEVVLFIDDDVDLPKDLVARHAVNYSDPAVIAVCGRVVQARRPWLIASRTAWPRRLDPLYFRPDGRERLIGIAALQGGNHSVRRERVIARGGYDENYIGWGFREESDLALRLWRAGDLIVFDPEAWLTHLQEPGGGCRYEGEERPLPDWMIAFPGAYFAMRHLFPTREFWKEILVSNFLRSVARMPNARRPWRLPFAVASYAVGVARAAARARARATGEAA